MSQAKRNRRKRKNRSLVSGLLVAVASIYFVARFFEVPGNQISQFFMSASLLVLAIIVLAIFVVTLMKVILKIGEFFIGSKKK